MELRVTDRQGVRVAVVIAHGQARELTSTKACGVQQHDGQAQILWTEGRIVRPRPPARSREQTTHFVVRKEMKCGLIR